MSTRWRPWRRELGADAATLASIARRGSAGEALAVAARRRPGRCPTWWRARARGVALAALAGAIEVDVAVFDRDRRADRPCRPLTDAPRILILGGTAEARALAGLAGRRAMARALDVVTSLAGRTARPLPLAGRVRRGGFGGAAGLARYLRRAKIDSAGRCDPSVRRGDLRNAAAAAAQAGVPRLDAAPARLASPAGRSLDRGRGRGGGGGGAAPRLGRRAG